MLVSAMERSFGVLGAVEWDYDRVHGPGLTRHDVDEFAAASSGSTARVMIATASDS